MPEFECLLRSARIHGVSLEERKVLLLCSYYECVLEGNKSQNLTRLTSPHDFFFGHIVDCLTIIESGFLGRTNLDLGSGAGVPGLVCAILDESRSWILSDSENSKAQFLNEAIEQLGLSKNCEVEFGRAEEILKKREVECVVTRAVGTLNKVYRLISKCSTWNTLVLLKGPKWEEEKAQLGPLNRKLILESEQSYKSGPEQKSRVLVKLRRTR